MSEKDSIRSSKADLTNPEVYHVKQLTPKVYIILCVEMETWYDWYSRNYDYLKLESEEFGERFNNDCFHDSWGEFYSGCALG